MWSPKKEENRLCQTDEELSRKQHCSPDPVLCRPDAGDSVFCEARCIWPKLVVLKPGSAS